MPLDLYRQALDEHRSLFDGLASVEPDVERIDARPGAALQGGGKLPAKCVDVLIIPSHTTARIQEAHIFVGHNGCAQIERILGLA